MVACHPWHGFSSAMQLHMQVAPWYPLKMHTTVSTTEMETVNNYRSMKSLNFDNLRSIYGGKDPCSYDPPEGFFRSLDYLIGYTFTKLRISVTG